MRTAQSATLVDMDLGEVIRRRRVELGMSQSDLARKAGVDARQIRRYETGEQQPAFMVGVSIAKALDIPIADLAGIPEHKVNLSGDWYAGWQSYKDGQEVIAVQPVKMQQQGELIRVEAVARGRSVEDGGYLWSGELRLWDNEILMGWYVSVDSSVRSKGTLFFVLHPQGLEMHGRWVGLSYDGKNVTGRGSMGRTEEDAHRLIREATAADMAATGESASK